MVDFGLVIKQFTRRNPALLVCRMSGLRLWWKSLWLEVNKLKVVTIECVCCVLNDLCMEISTNRAKQEDKEVKHPLFHFKRRLRDRTFAMRAPYSLVIGHMVHYSATKITFIFQEACQIASLGRLAHRSNAVECTATAKCWHHDVVCTCATSYCSVASWSHFTFGIWSWRKQS
jgi:hypothetical protein